jgi:hypothetical protein
MQPVVPLQYEIQINCRISLVDVGQPVSQANLAVTLDSVAVNGVDNDPANVTVAGVTTALGTAIKNWLADNKDIPA